jgi:drug/metabolite transporter (DMT)-like permease
LLVNFQVVIYFFLAKLINNVVELLRKIGSMRTGVNFSLSSFFGAALAFVVLKESFTLIQLTAGFVMILGIYVLYRCGKR